MLRAGGANLPFSVFLSIHGTAGPGVTPGRVRLSPFSVWHSRVHYSATRTSFATIFDVSESPIHRLSYAVPFVSIIIVVVEKSGGKVQGPCLAPSPQSKNSNALKNSETSSFDITKILKL